jgi:hypothetical protein
VSSLKSLPGGGPQGALLGGFMFMVNFNGAFLRPPIPCHLSVPISKATAKIVKFVDDGSVVAISINLKLSLVTDYFNEGMSLFCHLKIIVCWHT